jgi:hypothetical protein
MFNLATGSTTTLSGFSSVLMARRYCPWPPHHSTGYNILSICLNRCQPERFCASQQHNVSALLLGHCRDLERHRADHFGRFVNLSDVPIMGYGV